MWNWFITIKQALDNKYIPENISGIEWSPWEVYTWKEKDGIRTTTGSCARVASTTLVIKKTYEWYQSTCARLLACWSCDSLKNKDKLQEPTCPLIEMMWDQLKELNKKQVT